LQLFAGFAAFTGISDTSRAICPSGKKSRVENHSKADDIVLL
jgi:hypothetical protein